MKKIGLQFIIVLLTITGLNFSALSQSEYYTVSNGDNLLRRVDLATGTVISSSAMTMAGQTIAKSTGLAIHPINGTVYALLDLSGQVGRELAIIDTSTGIATSIGNTGDNFANITFDNSGVLYGVTGDGATVGESLFTLNLSTGAASLVLALGNGDDGEAIGYDADNGVFYHASGNAVIVFESINLPSTVANVTYSGAAFGEPTALLYAGSGNFILVSFASVFNITTSGVVTSITTGLSFSCKGIILAAGGGGGCTLATSASATNETSAGANDGTATATASGGTPPYTYNWSNFATTQTITGLAPGTYTIVITDAAGCVEPATVTVQAGGGGGCTLTASVAGTDETTAGANDGTATATPSGGTQPYTYTWSNFANTQSIAGLTPGGYTVTVSDAAGCTATSTVTIQAAGGCTLSATASVTPETSAGANDGTATASASGGTQPYTYNWSNFETTASITGLSPGSYTVIVSDAAGCSASATIVVQPAGGGCTLSLSPSGTDETSLGANDGTAAVVASGGTPPYTYSWSNFATTSSISGLAPATYTVAVMDAASCVESASITVFAGTNNCQLQASVTAMDESSMGGNNGSVMAVASGGTQPYTYSWSTGAATSSLPSVAPGVYSCTITDADGCTDGGTAVVQAFQCTLSGTMSSTDETGLGTFDGTATVTATGGTQPYTYAWNTFATTSTITGLIAGFYDVTVTDGNGCTYMSSAAVNPGGVTCNLSINVSGTNESQSGANDGTASVTITNGTALITSWSTGATTSAITNLAPGDYTVMITDSLGCVATGTHTVAPGLIISVYEQYTPMVSVRVYPNPGVDLIYFEITEADQMMLDVFDFAGRRVMVLAVNETLTEVNTSDLKNGLYFYQLLDAQGKKRGSGKFDILR